MGWFELRCWNWSYSLDWYVMLLCHAYSHQSMIHQSLTHGGCFVILSWLLAEFLAGVESQHDVLICDSFQAEFTHPAASERCLARMSAWNAWQLWVAWGLLLAVNSNQKSPKQRRDKKWSFAIGVLCWGPYLVVFTFFFWGVHCQQMNVFSQVVSKEKAAFVISVWSWHQPLRQSWHQPVPQHFRWTFPLDR